MTEHTWLTAQEVATRLRISPKTIYRWVAEGKVPAHRLGRTIRFRSTDIDNALQDVQHGDERARAALNSPRITLADARREARQ